jgi:hypothetical protein
VTLVSCDRLWMSLRPQALSCITKNPVSPPAKQKWIRINKHPLKSPFGLVEDWKLLWTQINDLLNDVRRIACMRLDDRRPRDH